MPTSIEEAKRRFPPMWVVYDRPRDFPGLIVCRVWYGLIRTDEVMVTDDLEQMRTKIVAAGGCVNLGRMEDDDPCIAECWV